MTRIATSRNPAERLLTYLSKDADICGFFKENIAASYCRGEALVHIVMAMVLLEAVVLFSINHFGLHFTTLPLSSSMFTTLPALFALWWVIGHVHRPRWPRFGLISTTFANLGIAGIIFIVAWASIVTTPFVIIDYHLVRWDQLLGFNVVAFMAWVQQFPLLVKILTFCYNTWVFQIVLVPLLLAALKKSQEINHYFIASAICLIFCLTIYYFFPTIAPAGIMPSPYFTQDQYNLVTRYYEVHQSLPISVFDGGIISFPSGHVIYALLVLVALRRVKWAFYPMVVINFFLIIATMALGYHYLVDVLASFAIVTIVLVAMRSTKRLNPISSH